MKYYIQYLEYDLAGKLSEPCGDRAVFILDGRNNLQTMHRDAIENNGKRRPFYKAYKIMKGDSFTKSRQITDILYLTNGE